MQYIVPNHQWPSAEVMYSSLRNPDVPSLLQVVTLGSRPLPVSHLTVLLLSTFSQSTSTMQDSMTVAGDVFLAVVCVPSTSIPLVKAGPLVAVKKS